MIVIDSSALVDAMLLGERGLMVRERLQADDVWFAPEIIDVEVAHVLRAAVRHDRVSLSLAEGGIRSMVRMRLRRFPHKPLLQRAWELRENLTPYDAVYVALAEALDAPLITLDRGMAGAPNAGARIELLA